jgi:hypothetical protein
MRWMMVRLILLEILAGRDDSGLEVVNVVGSA